MNLGKPLTGGLGMNMQEPARIHPQSEKNATKVSLTSIRLQICPPLMIDLGRNDKPGPYHPHACHWGSSKFHVIRTLAGGGTRLWVWEPIWRVSSNLVLRGS